jgi:NAD(P)-dependent dehydrogenase (short-subunit alcohol dehydrogenase family)
MGDRLQDKVALVVGGGQAPGETVGNGRAAALLFAREGARVMVADNRLDSAQETLAMIEKEGGAGLAFQADVTREADCRAMTEKCLETFGRIDILHNNVGIGERGSGFMFLELQEADWQRFMEVNLKGMFLTCHEVLPHMIKQGSGVILNVSSVASLVSTPAIAYKTSKAGVNALTHGLALEVARHGVRVNAILPGLMETPMAVEGRVNAYGQDREEVVRLRNERVPLKGGMGTGWDVGHAAVFLASEEAKFITGVLLPVDGGQSAKIG